MKQKYRVDLLFSNWILVWSILFVLKIVKSNPFFILIIAVIFNFGMIAYLLIKGCPLYDVIMLATLIFVLKFGMISYLYLTKQTKLEIIPVLQIAAVYFLYLYMNGVTIEDVYFTQQTNNCNYMPMIAFIKENILN